MNIKTNKDLIRAIENKKFIDVIIDKEGQYHVVFSKDVIFTEAFVKDTLLDKIKSLEDVIVTTVPSYQRFIKNEK